MRFIKDGPDVPERLVQAQEEGNVVFFCGAGVSYPAGLPGFQGLVKSLYSELGESFHPVEQTAFKENRLDSVVYLLERRIGNRSVVREKLWKILAAIDLTDPKSTQTHRSLLTLSKNRSGQTRLVTTNFDRLFDAAEPTLPAYFAPLLPVPKRTRWNGIVYLHGLLPARIDPTALNHLVVSSGDFGLAYLTERWASRFVTEIFREYTVCFVGYSLNDPVLRYMVDALAADQLRGEHVHEVYAFASYKKAKKDLVDNEWTSKGVTPVLYAETKDHRHLHKTLKTWA
ncbi:MAG TPA: SIR2 family protein, partial [Nitrospira sp.]|nr:SIR2 family protein [Nitrospira sp.]